MVYILTYCTTYIDVWGNAVDTHLQSLCKLQNKISRIINYSLYKETTNPHLHNSRNIYHCPKLLYNAQLPVCINIIMAYPQKSFRKCILKIKKFTYMKQGNVSYCMFPVDSTQNISVIKAY